jgi:hypothetical protein
LYFGKFCQKHTGKRGKGVVEDKFTKKWINISKKRKKGTIFIRKV